MAPLLELQSTGAHESCRTDWLTHSFKFTNEEEEQDLWAYFNDLSEKVLPTGGFSPPSGGKHYQFVYGHDSGVTFETSPLDSNRATRGQALVNIPGSVWGSLNNLERNLLITDIRFWPGAYRCTRWDPQITVLNSPINVAQVVADVQAGKLWAAGFSQQNPYGRTKADGSWVEPPTQYFGSPESNIRLRIYDHGVKPGWEEESLRVEVQIRKRYADDHFRRMAARCMEQRESGPLLVNAEERSVKDALVQHADFRDTTKWAGRPRPAKWRQSAPKPDWWKEVLDHRADPAQLSHRPEVSLKRTRAAGNQQYGRKFAMDDIYDMAVTGADIKQVLFMKYLETCSYLRQEDLLTLLKIVPEEFHERLRKLFHLSIEQAESWEDFAGPPEHTPPRG